MGWMVNECDWPKDLKSSCLIARSKRCKHLKGENSEIKKSTPGMEKKTTGYYFEAGTGESYTK